MTVRSSCPRRDVAVCLFWDEQLRCRRGNGENIRLGVASVPSKIVRSGFCAFFNLVEVLRVAMTESPTVAGHIAQETQKMSRCCLLDAEGAGSVV